MNLYFILTTIVLIVIDIIFTIDYKRTSVNKDDSFVKKISDVFMIIISCFIFFPIIVYTIFAIIGGLFITFKFYMLLIIGFLIFLLAILFCTDKQTEKIKNFIKKIIWNIEHKFNK